MTTQRAMTPAREHGVRSLNAGDMLVLDFVQPVYRKRRGFSDKRAMLKRFLDSGENEERMQRERIYARLVAIVYPKIAPEVEDDDECKGLRIRWIDGCKAADFADALRWQRTHLFDIGVIRAMDALTYHTDRHLDNAMVACGHVFPIDHEHCLEGPPRKMCSWSWGLDINVRKNGKSFQAGIVHGLDTIEQRSAEIADLFNTNKDGWTTTAEAIIEWVQWARGELLEPEERKAA